MEAARLWSSSLRGCWALANKPGRSSASTSASTLSGSTHDSFGFALIPIRTMASEMASGAGSSSAGRSPSALRMASTFARN